MTEILTCQLTNRGILRIGGEHRHVFLQGLISNDINLCTADHALYATLLTPQGKFLHDMFVTDGGDHFLIDCERDRVDDLLKRLMAFKLRAKVTFENVTDRFDVWATWGHAIPTKPHWHEDPRFPALGVRGIVGKGQPVEGQYADLTAYDKHRLVLGVPDGSRDMLVEKSTLLECNVDLLNGISWTKGCYMGQELTARMHYRALVKKRLFPFRLIGEAPAPGSRLTFNHEDVGEMRSSCDGFGLALVNIEKAQAAIAEGITFAYEDTKLNPYQPEWLRA